MEVFKGEGSRVGVCKWVAEHSKVANSQRAYNKPAEE